MNRWIFVFTAFAGLAAGMRPGIGADESSINVPNDTKYLLQLDLQGLRETSLGGKLLEIAKEKAKEELSDESGKGKGPDLSKIRDMIGFDPFEEIKTIRISGSHYDTPEKSVIVSVRLGKTSGNLEGLILGLPGYSSEEYGRYTIHSATGDENQRAFGAIHTDLLGDKTVLLASQRGDLTRQLDVLDGKPLEHQTFKTVKIASDGKTILSLEVFDIPTELIGDGPQSGVAKIVRAVSVRVGELKEKLDIQLWLTTATEQQAEQLRQMAQGLIALIGFAQSADPDDEDLKQFQKYLQEIKTVRDGLSLKVSLNMAVKELNELIDSLDLK